MGMFGEGFMSGYQESTAYKPRARGDGFGLPSGGSYQEPERPVVVVSRVDILGIFWDSLGSRWCPSVIGGSYHYMSKTPPYNWSFDEEISSKLQLINNLITDDVCDEIVDIFDRFDAHESVEVDEEVLTKLLVYIEFPNCSETHEDLIEYSFRIPNPKGYNRVSYKCAEALYGYLKNLLSK